MSAVIYSLDAHRGYLAALKQVQDAIAEIEAIAIREEARRYELAMERQQRIREHLQVIGDDVRDMLPCDTEVPFQ